MRGPLLLRSCNAAPPAQAVPRTGRLRRVDGDDAAVRPGADAVGRAAPGPLAAGRLADGPGHHRGQLRRAADRSEEHTSELQSLMRISYAVFCLKKKKKY